MVRRASDILEESDYEFTADLEAFGQDLSSDKDAKELSDDFERVMNSECGLPMSVD